MVINPEVRVPNIREAVLTNPLSSKVDAGRFLADLRTLDKNDIKDKAVVKRLDCLRTDPENKLPLSLLQGELLTRVSRLEPETNPNATQQQIEELRFYLTVAKLSGKGVLKEVDEYFADVEKDLPKRPGTFSRRKFAIGGIAAVTTLFLAPKAINTLTAPSEKPKPTNTAVPETKSPEATVTTSPTPKPPEPTKTPEPAVNIATEFLRPFIDYALQKRLERRLKNPTEYDRVVDSELNSNRINFVLMGYGEEHGETYKDMGGSITIMSYDTKTGKIGNISLSRDIRAPELEQRQPADKKSPRVLRHAYSQGGFDLLRKVSEDATGLASDFQLVLKDTVIRDLVRDVTGPVTVDVPKDHDTQGFRMDGKDYPPKLVPKGIQEMDHMQAMYYILSEDKVPVGKQDERSFRKNSLMKSISKALQANIRRNPFQLKTIKDFMDKKIADKDILFDFDPNLLDNSLKGLVNLATKAFLNLGNVDFTLPYQDEKQEVVFHDPFFGDGGVARIHNLRTQITQRNMATETVRKEADEKEMPDWMLIPDGGDPYAKDLVKNYWGSVRKLVKEKLS